MNVHGAACGMTAHNEDIGAAIQRERGKLRAFIRRRVRDRTIAEDILQDVLSEFVEAYRLPEPIERASAWLARVARNRIIDFFRRRRREQSTAVLAEYPDAEDGEPGPDLLLPSPDDGPEGAYLRSRLLIELQAALDELPANQRDVFVAHEFGGLSFREMAAQSGVAINTLLGRKRRAVLHLRDRLQRLYDELED
jgi:RNA polymerase sigma factor (sigma-70 family)